MVFLEMFLTELLGAVFLFLVDIMFGVFGFEPGLFLSIDHEVIGQFMIDVVEVHVREIVFG